MSTLPMIQAVCPAARAVQGTSPGRSGVVCGVMEQDAARADKILEGAPVGVFITAQDDYSTLFGFCCGTGIPAATPDSEQPSQHYSSCPIWAAGQEISEAERAFAPKPVESEYTSQDGAQTAPLPIEAGDFA